MQQLRAKFHCEQTTKTEYGQEVAKFRAVYTGTPEDNTYSAATPNASLEMTVSNPAAFGFFHPGKQYYLDITSADVPAELPDSTPPATA